MKALWGGTLMRYFLYLTSSESLLSSGIIKPSRSTLSVLFTRPFK